MNYITSWQSKAVGALGVPIQAQTKEAEKTNSGPTSITDAQSMLTNLPYVSRHRICRLYHQAVMGHSAVGAFFLAFGNNVDGEKFLKLRQAVEAVVKDTKTVETADSPGELSQLKRESFLTLVKSAFDVAANPSKNPTQLPGVAQGAEPTRLGQESGAGALNSPVNFLSPEPSPEPNLNPAKPRVYGATEIAAMRAKSARHLAMATSLEFIGSGYGGILRFVDQSDQIIEVPIDGDGVLDLHMCTNALYVNVNNCDSVKKINFPQNNAKIRYLSVVCCNGITEMDVSDLKSLREVKLYGLNSLPNFSAVDLKSLERISISNCEGLRALNFSGLAVLEKLVIFQLRALDELQTSKLDALEILEISQSDALERLDVSSFGALKNLTLAYCDAMRTIDGSFTSNPRVRHAGLPSETVSRLRTETAVMIDASVPAKKIVVTPEENAQCLATATSLTYARSKGEELIFKDQFNREVKIPLTENGTLDLREYANMRNINIERCEKVTQIIFSENNTKLRKVSINDCSSLGELDVSRLSELEELSLEHCWKLKALNFCGLKKLEKLILRCLDLKSLDVSSLESLTSIYVDGCYNITSLNFSGLNMLKNISLQCLYSMATLNISDIPSLIGISLTHCEKLNNLALSKLSSLARIKLYNLGTLTQLTISKLEALERIFISSCGALKALEFSKLPMLRGLDINYLKALESLRVSELSALQILELEYCDALRDFSGQFASNPTIRYIGLPPEAVSQLTQETAVMIDASMPPQYNAQ
jgi:hypothetical protein